MCRAASNEVKQNCEAISDWGLTDGTQLVQALIWEMSKCLSWVIPINVGWNFQEEQAAGTKRKMRRCRWHSWRWCYFQLHFKHCQQVLRSGSTFPSIFFFCRNVTHWDGTLLPAATVRYLSLVAFRFSGPDTASSFCQPASVFWLAQRQETSRAPFLSLQKGPF